MTILTMADANGASDVETNDGRTKLRHWLNQTMKIKMTDGRTLVGAFMCTDKDRNVILGNCQEFFQDREENGRMLGLAMVPGHHIVSMHIDETRQQSV